MICAGFPKDMRRRQAHFSGSRAVWRWRTSWNGTCREDAVVCLADKLIKEDRRVSLDVRYQKAFTYDPVKERILRDLRICRKLLEEFEVMTGEQL